jgi:5'(3')-deoxyribonucleotidase
MKIAVDIDGVCYNFVDELHRAVQKATGYDGPATAERWNFFKDWGFETSTILSIADQSVDAGELFWRGDQIPGTRKALETLRANGHTIHFCTARDYGTRSVEATGYWLNRQGLFTPRVDTLTFAYDKTVLAADILIDDCLDNAFTHSNCMVMSQLWNRVHEDGREWEGKRAADWKDCVAQIASQR